MTECNRGIADHDKGIIKGYYVFQFDKNSVDVEGILTGNRNTCDTEQKLHTKGENTGIHIALKDKNVTFTIATSFISYEQAVRNLDHDSVYGSFDELKAENERFLPKRKLFPQTPILHPYSLFKRSAKSSGGIFAIFSSK